MVGAGAFAFAAVRQAARLAPRCCSPCAVAATVAAQLVAAAQRPLHAVVHGAADRGSPPRGLLAAALAVPAAAPRCAGGDRAAARRAADRAGRLRGDATGWRPCSRPSPRPARARPPGPAATASTPSTSTSTARCSTTSKATAPARAGRCSATPSNTASPMILLGGRGRRARRLQRHRPGARRPPAWRAGGRRGEARYVLLGGEFSTRGGNGATEPCSAPAASCPRAHGCRARSQPNGLILFDCAGRAAPRWPPPERRSAPLRAAQAATASSRWKARANSSLSRPAAQRGTAASPSAIRRSSHLAVVQRDAACRARAGRASARGPRPGAAAPRSGPGARRRPRRTAARIGPGVGHALAVIARRLGDDRDLDRREAGQPGVEDQVARVLVVVVVVDRHADVVQHARRPQQLALARVAVVQPQRAPARRTCPARAPPRGACARRRRGTGRRGSARSRGARPRTAAVLARRPPGEQALEEDALAQPRLGRLQRRRSRRPAARPARPRAPARIRSARAGLIPGTLARSAAGSAARRSTSSSSASRCDHHPLHAVRRQAGRALGGRREVAHGPADADQRARPARRRLGGSQPVGLRELARRRARAAPAAGGAWPARWAAGSARSCAPCPARHEPALARQRGRPRARAAASRRRGRARSRRRASSS